MAETMYAQTDISTGEGTIERGEAVTAQSKGIGGKAGYDQLVESGAVKPEKPGDPPTETGTVGAAATLEELEEAKVSEPATPTRSGS